MDGGYVTFRLGERVYAASLPAIREIVRLEGLEELPGMQAPHGRRARAARLPAARSSTAGPRRQTARRAAGTSWSWSALPRGDAVGVVVDRVVSVLDGTELRKPSDACPAQLAAAVRRRRPAGRPTDRCSWSTCGRSTHSSPPDPGESAPGRAAARIGCWSRGQAVEVSVTDYRTMVLPRRADPGVRRHRGRARGCPGVPSRDAWLGDAGSLSRGRLPRAQPPTGHVVAARLRPVDAGWKAGRSQRSRLTRRRCWTTSASTGRSSAVPPAAARTRLACAALLPDRFAASLVVAGVAPYRAPGLDFLAGMGADNVTEFTAALAGEGPLREFLDGEIPGLKEATAAGMIKALSRCCRLSTSLR